MADVLSEIQTLEEIAVSHRLWSMSLRHFKNHLLANPQEFSEAIPEEFVGRSLDEVEQLFSSQLDEVNCVLSLSLLSATEALFRKDYDVRVKASKKDPLSRAFHAVRTKQREKKKNNRIPLDDILDVWKHTSPQYTQIIGDFTAAMNYRHWLAHGRFGVPKLGRDYDFPGVYTVCTEIEQNLPWL